jgi:predicted translin family RNA/ssDNA-binding protein
MKMGDYTVPVRAETAYRGAVDFFDWANDDSGDCKRIILVLREALDSKRLGESSRDIIQYCLTMVTSLHNDSVDEANAMKRISRAADGVIQMSKADACMVGMYLDGSKAERVVDQMKALIIHLNDILCKRGYPDERISNLVAYLNEKYQPKGN